MNFPYPYLPEGKVFQYVPGGDQFMKEALKVCISDSTDDKQPTGAVIVKNGAIVSRGANQSKLKNPLLKDFHEKGLCVRKILHIKTGEKYWLCPGCSGYDTHAEARAIQKTVENNINIRGADLYLWGHWWCCKPCWDKIIDAGIKDVFLLERSEVYFNRSNPQNKLGRKKFNLFTE